jgi:hypothetical protein
MVKYRGSPRLDQHDAPGKKPLRLLANSSYRTDRKIFLLT